MKELILKLIERKQFKEIKDILLSMNPVDIAEVFEDFEYKEQILLYRLLPKDEAADTFSNMNSNMQEGLINGLTDSEIRDMIDEMYLDDTVDMLEEMPANVVDRILMVTSYNKRSQINTFLNYPEDSAGSIMTVEYVALRKEMTVAEAIQKIRTVGLFKETIYTCYVTERRKLVGHVDVKDLLTSSDLRTIEEIMEDNTMYVDTHDDQEDVVKLIKKYGLIALPVVDKTNCMVGIITVDDAMIVLQEESTEDIARMAAINPSEDDYFDTSVYEHSKNRIFWLLVLMLTSTFTGLWIDQKQLAFEGMVLIVSFMPMIMGTGGNSGSQSAALMVRGLAVEEIKFEDIFRVMWKEIRVAFLVSMVLGIANGIRIYFMYDHNILLAITIASTLLFTIMLAKLVGCTLPLLAKKINMDPALMAAPLITTIVDAGSMFIYFTIVAIIFA
ncbi:MAG: magnesium transporter [Eubacteriales bacterium]